MTPYATVEDANKAESLAMHRFFNPAYRQRNRHGRFISRRRFYALLYLRRLAIGATLALATLCAAVSAHYLSDAYLTDAIAAPVYTETMQHPTSYKLTGVATVKGYVNDMAIDAGDIGECIEIGEAFYKLHILTSYGCTATY